MEELLYVKYSDERSDKFSLYTEIWQGTQGRFVRKYPESEAGMAHISHIYRIYECLSEQYRNTGLAINQCTEIDKGIELEYIEGSTLEQSLDHALQKNGEMAVVKVFSDLFQTIIATDTKPFCVTDEFREIFGEVSVPGVQESMPVTDIDMVAANFICNDTGMTLIDYEWTFEFPIPVKYVMYRTLHYYIETSLLRKEKITEDIYEQFGITQEQQQAFAAMEQNFQNFIQGKRVPIREMYEGISPGVTDVLPIVAAREQQMRDGVLQVFYSYGAGFLQEHSDYYPMQNGHIRLELKLSDDVTDVRIDPGNQAVICHIIELQEGKTGRTITDYSASGAVAGDGWIVYDREDPQFSFALEPGEDRVLVVELAIHYLETEILSKLTTRETYWRQQDAAYKETISSLISQKQQEEDANNRLQQDNARLIQEIGNIKNTKTWKLYEKYRRLRGRS